MIFSNPIHFKRGITESENNNRSRRSGSAQTPPNVASLFKSFNNGSYNENEFPMRIDIGSDDDADGSTGFPSTSTGINRSIASWANYKRMPDESINLGTAEATTVEVMAPKTTGKRPPASDQRYIANILDRNWTPAAKVEPEDIKEYEN